MGGYIAQCLVSLLEIKFGNSSQKASANRYHTFLVLPSFSGFLYFVPNILFGIAAPRRRCLGYSKELWCQKRWLLAWNQNRHITYSRPTSFASVSLLTFYTSIILATLWFTNSNVPDSRIFPFPRCVADSFCLTYTHHQTNYQWHHQTKIQINHHSKEVTLVTQKTHMSPENSRYQTLTVCQQTLKTPTQA